MYSSVYGPSTSSSASSYSSRYRDMTYSNGYSSGSSSNGYLSRPPTANRYTGASSDLGRRYGSGRRDTYTSSAASPASRFRPPLPSYTGHSVTRSTSSYTSANGHKAADVLSSANAAKNAGLRTRPPYKRSMSLSPSRLDEFKYRETIAPVRSLIRESFQDESGGRGLNGSSTGDMMTGGSRLTRRSPSVTKERTRDELIDSIVHTRTREHRVMPGFHNASDWEERKVLRIDCDKVYPGIILGNAETIQNVEYLRGIGVTHVLNTAERHVGVNPAKYPLHGISYFGFHVDDHPMSNIARFFGRTTDFIEEALSRQGLIVVNCVMGWSRSATVVAAYLMMKKGMSSAEALEIIRQSRPIRPNPGFLQQLADHENLLKKKPFW